MGCDIHAYIEVKVNDRWVTYTRPRIKRHYGLFTKINGTRSRAVCDETPPIIPVAEILESIPEDASEITKIDYEHDGSDAHSVSVLNVKQMEEVFRWGCENIETLFEHYEIGYLNGNSFYAIKDEDNDLPKDYQDVRMIVWFDN